MIVMEWITPSEFSINITGFFAQNGINNNFFETSAQILAAFLAIIFSISLFVIEMSSEKYSPKIKKYYGESNWTRLAFGFALFTILACLLSIYFNIQNNLLGAVVFLLLIANFFFFFFYYNHMKDIIDPYIIADLLRKDCVIAATGGKNNVFKDIVASFADMIIKAINDRDIALSIKYARTINKINYDIFESSLSPKQKIALREIVFNEVGRALQYSIDNNDESRIPLNELLFEAIHLEVTR